MLQLTIINQVAMSPPRRHMMRPLPDSSIYAPSFPMSSLRAKIGTNNNVVVVMGATGTGKSKLAIDLARRLGGEVVNSDKMQVYDGLNVVTNKVTEEECMGVRHHLINGVHPDVDFSASNFCEHASRAVDSIAKRGLLPIIAGGSNSYIKELIEGANGLSKSRYRFCFLWVDVQISVLHSFVSDRVDRMVQRGLVDEVRALFDPNSDYSKGLRRAIGVPELDAYIRSEGIIEESDRAKLLADAIDDIKANTRRLTWSQLKKIDHLSRLPGWNVDKIDATEVFRKQGEEVEMAWESVVAEPGVSRVRRFLFGDSELSSDLAKVMEKRMVMARPGKTSMLNPRSLSGATI